MLRSLVSNPITMNDFSLKPGKGATNRNINPSAQAQTIKKRLIKKQCKMYIGCLHCSSTDSQFKDGEGVCDYSYNDDDEISEDFLWADAKKAISFRMECQSLVPRVRCILV